MFRRLLTAIAATLIGVSVVGITPSAGQPAPTVPEPPSDITYFVGCFDQGSIEWRAPGFDGGSPITGYTIYADGSVLAQVGPDTFEYGPLTEGPEYTMSASNDIGESEAVRPDRTAIPGCVLPAPELSAGPDCGRTDISWSEPDHESLTLEGYTAYLDGAFFVNLPPEQTTLEEATPALPGPPGPPDTEPQTWEVTARYEEGESQRSNAVTIPGCAGPPDPRQEQPRFTG